MANPIKPDFARFEQLALDINLPEAAVDGDTDFVSPEEARTRSETARNTLEVRSLDSTPWMADYLQLRDAGWTWRVAAYIAWASCPKKERWPRTQELLATEVLGLTSDRQIYTWRLKNPSIDEVIATLQSAPLFEHRADIYEALIKSATNADYKNHNDRELALKLLQDYVPRQDVNIRDPRLKEVGELSDDQLIKLAGEMDSSSPLCEDRQPAADGAQEEQEDGAGINPAPTDGEDD